MELRSGSRESRPWAGWARRLHPCGVMPDLWVGASLGRLRGRRCSWLGCKDFWICSPFKAAGLWLLVHRANKPEWLAILVSHSTFFLQFFFALTSEKTLHCLGFCGIGSIDICWKIFASAVHALTQVGISSSHDSDFTFKIEWDNLNCLILPDAIKPSLYQNSCTTEI